MNEKEISHPYLDTFEALMTIKNFDYTSGLRKRYRQLAKQMGMDVIPPIFLYHVKQTIAALEIAERIPKV